MSEISVVMSVYNSEEHVNEAIESVLAQSFEDFEFIIVDDGSIDNTYSIILSYVDDRIKLIQNKHDYARSLNIGINNARGRYIARMDADDIMHVDRLKVQYAVMQEYEEVTVCGSRVNVFGTDSKHLNLSATVGGLIEDPILELLKSNFLFHSTVMLRADFLRKHSLQYENYLYAEDYKFWTEIAKLGGRFYVENQPLLYHRASYEQTSDRYGDERKKMTEVITTEIIAYLIGKNNREYPELSVMYDTLCRLQEKQLFTRHEIIAFVQNTFSKNKEKMNL